MKQHRILLADDHALVRAGIKSLMERIPGFQVCAEASDVPEARRRLEQTEVDIVVTDISMGDESGLDLARHVRDRFPATRVVVVSMHTSEDLAAEALRLGASGYLLKEAAPAELEIALRAATRGEIYMSPAISARMMRRLMEPASTPAGLNVLTARQVQILTLIARRKATKEIAYELDLSEKTVAAHRSQIMHRLGVRDVVGLALFAMKHGLIKGER